MNGAIKHLSLLFLCVLLWQIRGEAKQLAVVVAKSNVTSGLSTADLIKIFKLEGQKWPDGKSVTLVIFDPSSADMQLAVQKIYKMQPDGFRAWIALHSSSIVVVRTEEDLLKMVQSTPGAVGLVDVYSITNKVNVLKVDGKLPLEQGYFLKGN